MRFAARRDDNEAELVDLAEGLGADWYYGPPLDGWLWSAGTGWVPVEIKNPNGRNRYTESQKKFIARCVARGIPWLTWRDEDDVLNSLGAKRSA